MNGEGKRDALRQAANVVGALFQAGMTLVASASIQEVVESGPPSLVEPAGYAFTIWALIFALSLAYAVYQALPANRQSPLLRRIGWFTATAFFFTGMWSVFVFRCGSFCWPRRCSSASSRACSSPTRASRVRSAAF